MNAGRIKRSLVIASSLLMAIALTAETALAQQFEVHPYVGGYFPRGAHKEGSYGVRAGGYLMDFVELETNFGVLTHLNLKSFPGLDTRAYVWDFNGSLALTGYSSSLSATGFQPKKVEPYVTVGVGALFTPLSSAASSPRKEFLTFNYGGGIKGVRLWGPVGLRADIRGRTMPNFQSKSQTWIEASGGLNFIFGER